MNFRGIKMFWATALALICFGQPGLAERSQMVDDVLEALRMDETLSIMRKEGMTYGEDVADQMIPNVDREAWMRKVGQIYDAERMFELVRAGFAAELETRDLEQLLLHLRSEQGREIISLEISARRAFLDPDTEAAAKARVAQLAEQGDPLFDQITTLIRDGDLVETNVVGALNADLMFYKGLVQGGAFQLTDREMLSAVWQNEPMVRASTTEWLEAFLSMAYQPLDEATLDDYIAFWRSEEGQALNRALFAGFDEMYDEISFRLGLAVAWEMVGEDL